MLRDAIYMVIVSISIMTPAILFSSTDEFDFYHEVIQVKRVSIYSMFNNKLSRVDISLHDFRILGYRKQNQRSGNTVHAYSNRDLVSTAQTSIL